MLGRTVSAYASAGKSAVNRKAAAAPRLRAAAADSAENAEGRSSSLTARASPERADTIPCVTTKNSRWPHRHRRSAVARSPFVGPTSGTGPRLSSPSPNSTPAPANRARHSASGRSEPDCSASSSTSKYAMRKGSPTAAGSCDKVRRTPKKSSCARLSGSRIPGPGGQSFASRSANSSRTTARSVRLLVSTSGPRPSAARTVPALRTGPSPGTSSGMIMSRGAVV